MLRNHADGEGDNQEAAATTKMLIDHTDVNSVVATLPILIGQ